MIRFRDKRTGAEAAWDRGRWSGDPDLARQMEVRMRIEHLDLGPSTAFGDLQADMAERLPPYGLVVVEQTTPKELPRFDSQGHEIIR